MQLDPHERKRQQRDGDVGNAGEGDNGDGGDGSDDDDLKGEEDALAAAAGVWRRLRAEYARHTADLASLQPEKSVMVDTGEDSGETDKASEEASSSSSSEAIWRSPSMYHVDSKLKKAAAAAVQPLVERWAGVKVQLTSVYGTRVYHNGSVLYRHVGT